MHSEDGYPGDQIQIAEIIDQSDTDPRHTSPEKKENIQAGS